ncbi:hypothetical protein KV337_002055 [Escherichia coli]|uniref:Uncharacterized protein n=1 Tax=Escherichia coli TaxID=562 RepID=A0AAI9FDX0_ECOLX|nr:MULTISPECIES: hypothetical protein [Escherichia]HDQ6534751.1 hypothetical protein [Escherichia coli O36:H14]ANO87392.1 hypothetical protein GJ11_01270 [Escherichia coli]EFB2827893.1 hypothetical protein [Escherichia coli]EFI6952122.1 hypothetical protein [Escherichia coli]EFN1903151.1 hypothetical protein [Escherichia coli]
MVEQKNKNLLLNQGEVAALKKAIMYLKFSCEETESLLYAGSPLINSVFAKLLDIDDLGQQAKEFYSKKHAQNERFILAKLKKSEEEDDIILSKETREKFFEDCLYPFTKNE